MNLKTLSSFDTRLRCQIRHHLKSRDVFWPTIWIATVVKGIDPDEDVRRTQDLGPSQGKRQEDGVSCWNVGNWNSV
jgi:hypothetical protein